jgi:hypothetical protein
LYRPVIRHGHAVVRHQPFDAHAARKASRLVAAGGFEPAFVEVIRAEREEVYLWYLATLYRVGAHRARQLHRNRDGR